ncbi:MAG TPA: PIN domain-containing protein [Steroidobacteraceae bacterium]|nr:PIN domain-containing protein [Steroidobacteraceae bacterium]
MNAADSFFDTSVLLYLLSKDAVRADRVEALLVKRGVISVQVLNEFTAVATRKFKMPLAEVREILETIRSLCRVEPVTVETHDRGLVIIKRYRFALYDSMLVAAALIAGCRTLYSEDLQHGQVIDRQLRISNPFADR